ncbi:MAG: hypothetical protein DRP08_03265 [Candidatus Aenigmatarchaeota archaeon]|nr:MAG: hypothetical protein DRP08_03265 [Candidatus Aenigmarchaeota archaeon]
MRTLVTAGRSTYEVDLEKGVVRFTIWISCPRCYAEGEGEEEIPIEEVLELADRIRELKEERCGTQSL